MLSAGATLLIFALVSCSKPANSNSAQTAGPKVVQAQETTLGAPGDWDSRTDLTPSEPVNLKEINTNWKKPETASGELIRGSINLAASDIKYYDRPSKGQPAASPALPPETEPLQVVDYGPEGELPIEMRSPTIYVMFNLPIVPLAKLGEPMTSSNIMTIDPHVDGVYRWYGTRTLSFEPTNPLIDQPLHTVHISADTASLGGRRLGKTVSFELYSETVKIVNFYPGGNPNAYVNKREVPTADARLIILEFNQEVDPSHIARYLTVDVGGSSAPFRASRPTYPDRLKTRPPAGCC